MCEYQIISVFEASNRIIMLWVARLCTGFHFFLCWRALFILPQLVQLQFESIFCATFSLLHSSARRFIRESTLITTKNFCQIPAALTFLLGLWLLPLPLEHFSVRLTKKSMRNYLWPFLI